MNKRAPYNDYKYKRNANRQNQISDVMLNLKVIPNGTKMWKFYSKGMVEYVADHQELLHPEQVDLKQNKNTDAYGSYLSYMTRKNAKYVQDINPAEYVWHYSNLKQYKGQDISTQFTCSNKCRLELCKLNEVRKIHKKSNIWSIVISERDLDMKDIMFQNQHKIADRIIRSLFPFPVDATIAFHGNTEHQHIHIMAYQPELVEQKHIMKKWKITKKRLENAKKSYYYYLINNKNYFLKLLEEKSKLRTLYNGEILQRVLNKQFIKLLDVLAKDKEILKDKNGNIIYGKSGKPIYAMKFQFNRLDQEQKNAVINLKNFLLNLSTNEEEINKFQEQYKKFIGIGMDLIEKEFDKLPNNKRDSLISKTKELFAEADEKICQQLLKTAKEFYETNQNLLRTVNSNFNESSPPVAQLIETNMKPAENKALLPRTNGIFNDLKKSLIKNQDLTGNLTALKQLIQKFKKEYEQCN